MKTFNDSDLITWANRDKAKLCEMYYFSNSVEDIQRSLEENSSTLPLTNINDSDIANTFECQKDEYTFSYACILPVDAVKEIKLEKKYRACQTIKEFYEVINNYGSDSFPNKDFTDENFMYNLLDTTIHFRSKNTGTEYYSIIRSVSKKDTADIRILLSGKSYLSFEQIFENYEIELNGKWLPFGVLDDN